MTNPKTQSETESEPTRGASLQPILKWLFSFGPERCLMTAVQLDVFSAIAAGGATAEEVAEARGCSARGMRMLLDVLTSIELLVKTDGRYALTPSAEEYLVRSSPQYVGSMMETDSMWTAWSGLPEAVRTGQPQITVEREANAEKFFSLLVRSLHVMNAATAGRAARAILDGGGGGAPRVLDVACGSGVWGIALAEASPAAQLTLQDFPGVLEVARGYAERHGVADRCNYLAGNLRKVDFGSERFDVAILGNIVHSEGEASSRELFGRLHAALAPGGQIAIIDLLPNEDRTAPPHALVFAVNMLVHTESGDTYTFKEYEAWLSEAGFSSVQPVEIGAAYPMIIGVK